LQQELEPILDEYKDVLDGLTSGLPPERAVNHSIDLEPGKSPPSRGIYPLAETELAELRRQLEDLTSKGFIMPSASPCG